MKYLKITGQVPPDSENPEGAMLFWPSFMIDGDVTEIWLRGKVEGKNDIRWQWFLGQFTGAKAAYIYNHNIDDNQIKAELKKNFPDWFDLTNATIVDV